MRKFKVGDRVRVVLAKGHAAKPWVGHRGVVVLTGADMMYPVGVRFDGQTPGSAMGFLESELEYADDSLFRRPDAQA